MTLYLFIDESGNFDFTPKGTKHFILTGFATFDPVIKRDALIRIRYELLENGINQEYFHATEDAQTVRNEIFSFLAGIGSTYEIHSVYALKKIDSDIQKESHLKIGVELYRNLCESLLENIFKNKPDKVNKIVIVLSSLFVGEKNKILLQTIKHYVKSNFNNVRFEIYSHKTALDLNCQLADYCCWAISVKINRGEIRPYETIKSQIKSIKEYV